MKVSVWSVGHRWRVFLLLLRPTIRAMALCSGVETIANFNHRPLYCQYGSVRAGNVVLWLAGIFLDKVSLGLHSAIYWVHDRVSKHSDFHRERASTLTPKMSNFTSTTKHFSLGPGRALFQQKKGSIYKIFENGIGQSVHGLLNHDMGFIRPRYRWATECHLWDPYQLAAKDSWSHRERLLHLCVCKLQVCWH